MSTPKRRQGNHDRPPEARPRIAGALVIYHVDGKTPFETPMQIGGVQAPITSTSHGAVEFGRRANFIQALESFTSCSPEGDTVVDG